MANLKHLDPKEIQNDLPQWNYMEGELHRNFSFSDFSEALAFIVRVGVISERMNHHPTITNTYNKVNLRISTHSEKAITELDKTWILAVEKLLS